MRVPIPAGVKLYIEQSPKTQEEEDDMPCIPYESAIGILMYAKVFPRLDITPLSDSCKL